MKKLLSIKTVSERLDVSTRSIYRLVADGYLVALKVRGSLRITESSLDKFCRRQILEYSINRGINLEDFVSGYDSE